jgi:hypothetical protein
MLQIVDADAHPSYLRVCAKLKCTACLWGNMRIALRNRGWGSYAMQDCVTAAAIARAALGDVTTHTSIWLSLRVLTLLSVGKRTGPGLSACVVSVLFVAGRVLLLPDCMHMYMVFRCLGYCGRTERR